MSVIIKVFALVCLILAVAYLGTCVYSNVVSPKSTTPKVPDVEVATYAITVENTGMLLFAKKYELSGAPGKRVIILTGYWEMVGQGFKYRDSMIVLDEKVFGTITIRRR